MTHTLAELDVMVGALTEAQNDKMDTDGRNGTNTIDYVVEWQLPTSQNNYTWYRKYKSGWVEQGGAVTGLTDWATKTITFPIQMQDRGYFYTQSPIMYNSGGHGSWEPGITLKTETQITTQFYSNNGYLPTWEVKGMAASA